MKIFQAIGSGINVTTRNLRLILWLTIFQVVSGVLTIALAPATATVGPEQSPFALIPWWFWIWVLIVLLVGVFFQSGVLTYLKEALRSGTSNWDQFLAGAKKFFVRILVFGLLFMAAILIAAVLVVIISGMFGLVFGGGSENAGGAVAVIFSILLGIGVFVGSIFLIFSPMAIVAGDEKLFVGVMKSVQLVTKYFWRSLGLYALLVAFIFLANLIVSIVVNGLFGIIIRNMTILNYVVTVINAPFIAYFTTIFTASLLAYYISLSSSAQAPGVQRPGA